MWKNCGATEVIWIYDTLSANGDRLAHTLCVCFSSYFCRECVWSQDKRQREIFSSFYCMCRVCQTELFSSALRKKHSFARLFHFYKWHMSSNGFMVDNIVMALRSAYLKWWGWILPFSACYSLCCIFLSSFLLPKNVTSERNKAFLFHTSLFHSNFSQSIKTKAIVPWPLNISMCQKFSEKIARSFPSSQDGSIFIALIMNFMRNTTLNFRIPLSNRIADIFFNLISITVGVLCNFKVQNHTLATYSPETHVQFYILQAQQLNLDTFSQFSFPCWFIPFRVGTLDTVKLAQKRNTMQSTFLRAFFLHCSKRRNVRRQQQK